MDVIALHAAGFENAVATLGTALTSEQARMMAKYTKKVIISYDSDEAGQRAAARAVSMLSDVGLEVRILKMNGAKDPDEYIKKFGADEFRRTLGLSRTGFEYRLENVLSKYDISFSENKVKAASELTDYISEVWSAVERDVYISVTAERLGLGTGGLEGLKSDVENKRRRKIKEYKAKVSQQEKMSAMGIGDRINSDAAKNIRAAAAEEAVLGLLLMRDEYRSMALEKKIDLSAEDFFTEFNRRVFEKIMELQAGDGFVYSALCEFFNPEEMGRLQSMEQKRRVLTENGKEVLFECIATLKSETASKESGSSIDDIQNLLASKRAQKGNKST